MARSTQQIFREHMAALERGDLPGLMADYAKDAVLITMDAVFEGKDAVQGYFVGAFSAFPGMKTKTTGERVHGDMVLCTWTADAPKAKIPTGVDTFIIREDKIRLQTCWYTVVPK